MTDQQWHQFLDVLDYQVFKVERKDKFSLDSVAKFWKLPIENMMKNSRLVITEKTQY